MKLAFIILSLQVWESVQVSLPLNVTCSNPPSVPHAYMSEESKKAEHHEGDVIYFTCETGYISGPTIRYLCSDGKWLEIHKGKCFLKPCELPDDTPNGYYHFIIGEDFVFGATIKYFCNEGYQMVSKDDTRTCLLDKWTNHVPICDPLSCDLPPADGRVIIKGLPDNDDPILPDRFLTFSCEGPGVYLNGSSMLICGRDGQWDNPFPTCEDITCNVELMHSHLHVLGGPPTNEKIKIGHKLQFYCNNQYVLDGPQEIECLQTGQWNQPFPTCAENCRVLDIPSSMYIRPYVPNKQVRKGQKLHFFCRRLGHFLRGSKEVECLANGQWSDPYPTCGAPVGCGKPPPLEGGDIKKSVRFQYQHNEEVEYTCQSYYTMSGNAIMTCINGEWIGEMRCLKPCTVDSAAMARKNIIFRYSSRKKLYSHHLEETEFQCARGRTHDRQLSMRQRCDDGVMHLPTCF